MLGSLLISNNAQAELSKESIYEQLKNTYKGMESISFNYSFSNNPNIYGSIKAKKGNKYIISMADRDIYCNGETIWNVSKYDKKAIISSYEEDYEEALSIENIFFYFLDKYKPSKLAKENTSKGSSHYVLSLTPKGQDSEYQGIKAITLWLDYNDLEIEKVKLDSNNGINEFNISKVKRNKKIKNSDFEFEVPADMEVIDFR
jgi:outer membrane lipoprotein-sorting protein